VGTAGSRRITPGPKPTAASPKPLKGPPTPSKSRCRPKSRLLKTGMLKMGTGQIKGVRATFDLSLFLDLESPPLDLREEANHSVEPGQLEVRVGSTHESKIFRREETHSAGHARALRTSHGKRCNISTRSKLRLRAVVCFEATRVKLIIKPDQSYPKVRTRRLRKTQSVACPRAFNAVGPFLRL
jgi:hypothetical protein